MDIDVDYHYSTSVAQKLKLIRQSNVRKSNLIEPNRTQSVVEFGNRTKSNTELCVSSISEQSNSIEQIGPNQTKFIRLFLLGFGSQIQSNKIQWIAFNCSLNKFA